MCVAIDTPSDVNTKVEIKNRFRYSRWLTNGYTRKH